ncbi:MAG: PQQ-dependent sugar dehydrogenase [Ilumatobacteraceae bacterium]
MRLVALVVATAVVAACAGSSDDGSGSTTTDQPASSVGSTSSAAPTPIPPSSSVAPPSADSITLVEVASGLERPVDLVWRDDVPYAVEQSGLVVPLRDGRPGEPVLDIRSIVSTGGEQGLLALEFAANTAYVNYTNLDGDTVVAALSIGSDGIIDPRSARILLTIDQPYANHNGGDLHLGPDGMLYIATGDGGSAGDPERVALDTSSLLGKILRIDPRLGSDPIPDDNPFVGVAGARPEIWSLGLRNPWRFDIDPLTGDLWVADVGQNLWEEVNHVVAGTDEVGGRGANFGWSALEGTHRFNDDQDPDGAVAPVFEYPHGDAGCSVSGGAVYTGSAIPSLFGWFVAGDFCSGRVFALHADDAVAITVTGAVSAVRRGPDGEVYILDHSAGRIVRLAPA